MYLYRILTVCFLLIAITETKSFGQITPNEESFVDLESSSYSECNGCTGCSGQMNNASLPFQEFPFMVTLFAVFVLLVFKKYKYNILFWIVGVTLFAGFMVKVVQNHSAQDNAKNSLLAANITSIEANNNNQSVDNWRNPSADNEKENTDIIANSIEQNEFEEFEEFSELDEFDEFDELEEFDESSEFGEFNAHTEPKGVLNEKEKRSLLRTLLALAITVIAGLLFRFSQNTRYRYLILLVTLIYFGFYSGGCPCMISSFQHVILLLLGEQVQWINLVWFLGLLPITYFLGKVWCGWVCHLGAFQEFIYRPAKKSRLLSPGVQKTLKVLQVTAIILLLIQLFWTRSNLFIKIDPFKVAFNLYSTKLIGYILLAILLVSSLFIYRPFCRGFCPVGLILGWVGKIPGAFGLKIKHGCTSCKKCEKGCSYQAISKIDNRFSINNSECIMCGDCIDACRKGVITKI